MTFESARLVDSKVMGCTRIIGEQSEPLSGLNSAGCWLLYHTAVYNTVYIGIAMSAIHN